MKQTDDTLLREALRRRAERLPMLPGDITERIMKRMEGGGRLVGETTGTTAMRWWPTIASIGVAAAIVVGLFIGRQGHEEMATPIQPPVAEDVPPSPIPPQEEGVYTPAPVSKATQPKEDVPQVSRHSASSLIGRGGGESAPAPSLSELYASIDEMTDVALQEADRLTVEAMTCGLSDDRPS